MKKEILVIDDNSDIRLLISGILKDKGFAVREGANYKFAFLSKDFNLWVLESENTKEFK